MKKINLFESNDAVKISRFAGGENHVRLLGEFLPNDKVLVQTRLNSADDIMNLVLTVDALRNMFVEYIEVAIPYIPYARQDRVMVKGEPLSIKVFAQLLNSLQLNKVTVFDAHSDVSVALIDRCVNVTNDQLVKAFVQKVNLTDFNLVSPDLGAYKKIDKLAQKIGFTGEIITGIKIRDLSTGQIVKSDVNVERINGKACLIVDDICDGGRTFIELALALKAKNAGDLYFIASHGIFSHNALERLKEAGYKNVCSSNSISNIEVNKFYKSYNVF